jgi:hypothetical protein
MIPLSLMDTLPRERKVPPPNVELFPLVIAYVEQEHDHDSRRRPGQQG